MSDVLPVLAIPGLVPFPFTIVHLHIFEPRYRVLIQNVQNSSSKELLLAQGVALKGSSSLSKIGPGNSPDFFDKNHRIYEPVKVAALARLTKVQELHDGRKFVTLEVCARVCIEQHTQRIPFVVASYSKLHDNAACESDSDQRHQILLSQLVPLIERIMLECGRQASALPAEHKNNLASLSFAVMRFFVVDPELGQKYLEDCDAVARAETLLLWLRNSGSSASSTGCEPQGIADALKAESMTSKLFSIPHAIL